MKSKLLFVAPLFLGTIFIMLASCANDDNENPTPALKPISYLALGDSYTIGQGINETERWPNQLSDSLLAQGFKFDKTEIIAKTGWTTTNLLSAIESAELDSYNLVSLLIGVNNQYQRKDFSVYELEFDSLLNIAISLAGDVNRVFVVSIPDYGVTPFGNANKEQISTELDKYNAFAKSVCLERGVAFINITDISRELGSKPGALATDNLHPSGYQYTKWTSKILPVLKELFN